MPAVDPVIVQLRVDAAQYNRELRASTVRFDAAAAQMEASGQRFGASLRGAIGGAVAALSAQQLFSLAKGALDYASSLGEVSQQLGVTARDLQVLQYAGSQVGLSNDEVRDGLGKLTRKLGEAATGSVGAQKALQIVGFSLKELSSGAITAGDAVPRIADFLAKVQSPAQRAAIELELFGRAGQRLDTLLAGGSSEIDNLRDAAERLGIVLSDDQIQRADETADKLAEIKQVLASNIASTVADNAQSIVGLAQALGTLTGQIVQFLNSNPQAALGIIGGLAGARLGPIGAGLGAAAGVAAGDRLARNQGDQNNDLTVRRQAYAQAARRYNQLLADQRGTAGGSSFFSIRRQNPSVNIANSLSDARAEADRQLALFRRARDAGKAKPQAKDGPADPKLAAALASLNAPKPSAPAKIKDTTKQTAREAVRRREEQDRIGQQIAAAQVDYLQEMVAATQDAAARAALEATAIEATRTANEYTIRHNDHLNEAQRNELIYYNNRVAGLRQQELQQREEERLRQSRLAATTDALRSEDELLQLQSGLADTAKERREIELRRLDIADSLERANIAEDIAAATIAGDTERLAAGRKRLADLEEKKALQTESVRRDTESPGQRYRRQLDSTSKDINAAIEQVEVEGLDRLNDGLADAITGAKSLGDAFKDVANSIIRDLLRIAIQQAIIKPIAGALFGGDGGGGGAVGSLLGSIFGRASGGYVGAGQTVRVNEGRGGVELLRMGAQGGTVIPLGQAQATPARGGGDRHFHIAVDARNSVTPAGFAQALSQEILGRADAMDQQRQGQTLRAAPSAVGRAQRFGA